MDLFLTLLVPDQPAFDVQVSANTGAPVSALVDALGAKAAEQFGMHLPPGQAWAARLERTGMTLDEAASISESGLLSGDLLQVGTQPAAARAVQPDHETTSARLLVVGGRLVGLSFTVPPGSHTVGRSRTNSIVLSDPSISRNHFTLHVGERIEIEDAGSLNGTFLGGDAVVGRRVVDPDAIIEAGDYAFRAVREGAELDSPAAQGVIAFNRPPRVERPYTGRDFEVPPPPNDPARARLPWIAALIPVAMGLVMFGAAQIAQQPMSPVFLIFFAMAPAMAIGTYFQTKRSGAADFKEQAERYRAKMSALVTDLRDEHVREITSRRHQAPEPAVIVERIVGLRPELYERSLADEDFLALRVGLADQPSCITISYPDGGSDMLRAEVSVHLDGWETAEAVPALVPLREVGGLGVAGPADHARALGRWLIVQAVTLHSPAELIIAGIVGSERLKEWEWLKWLPHTRSVTSPIADTHLAATEATAEQLLDALLAVVRERLAEADHALGSGPPGPAILVLFDEFEPIDRHRLTELLTQGPDAGVHFVWVGSASDQIPHFCGAVAEVNPDRASVDLKFATDGSRIRPCTFEALSAEDTAACARRLAPIVDNSVPLTRDAGVPRSVPLIDLIGGTDVLTKPETIQHRWTIGTELRAPLGVTGRGQLALDIRSDGPHGLVAGTTGAGKSELLQSLVASLAATHPPTKLTFLLVDYKGGAAFKECKDLPHTVGFVTDLNEHLTRRALTSLNAEITRREHILGAASAKDLRDMERKGIDGAPPNILIVIDEFAALAKEVPEFVAGMVDIAQRGRSLGMHLLLATQRPAGVVTDNIRANTNMRIALRVAEEPESVDVIGTKAAHKVDVSTPGRAFARIGSNDPVQFQAGYVGGHSLAETTAPDASVAEFEFEARVGSLDERPDIDPAKAGDTDLMALVANINRATAAARITHPRTPLLAPLDELIDLRELLARPDATGEVSTVARSGRASRPVAAPGGALRGTGLTTPTAAADGRNGRPGNGDAPTTPATGGAPAPAARTRMLRGTLGVRPTVAPAETAGDGGAPHVPPDVPTGPLPEDHVVVLGVVDKPDHQTQELYTVDLDRDGSLLAFGTGGTGKTVFLRTVAAALSQLTTPAGLHIYALDFASRGLSALAPIPQVGDVLTGEDTEQVMRLFRTLQQRINHRRNLLAAYGASNLTEYRSLCPDGDERERIVVLLDGYAGFTATYEKIQGGELLDLMPRLISDGRSVGIHFVITGDRRGAIPSSLLGVITRRIILRMSSKDEYANVGVDTRLVDLEAVPGRAIVDGLELQVAIVGSEASGEAQQRALDEFGRSLTERSGGSHAPAVGLLPEAIALTDIPTATAPLTAIFGIGDNDLAPTGIDLNDSNCLIAGPNRSGRSTALVAIARSLARSAQPPELHLVAGRRRELVDATAWTTSAVGEQAATESLAGLRARLEADGCPRQGVVVIIDDLTDLTETSADEPLKALIKFARDHDVRVVAAGENSALRRSSFNAAGELRKDKTGLLLQPDLELDGDILGARIPRRAVLRLPVGRGFIVRRGVAELFQVASPTPAEEPTMTV